ncbi:MAG: hypothetical protein JWM93_155 [Frankiales bacterium]|nr:hypothetical protein [Frankiales bacterium]
MVRGTVEGLLGEPGRIYVAGREPDGSLSIDVVDEHGVLEDRWEPGEGLAEALLRDATGHAPRPATVTAFADEVVDRLPPEGFVMTSGEICAWLLLRAIERSA